MNAKANSIASSRSGSGNGRRSARSAFFDEPGFGPDFERVLRPGFERGFEPDFEPDSGPDFGPDFERGPKGKARFGPDFPDPSFAWAGSLVLPARGRNTASGLRAVRAIRSSSLQLP
ncbi:hypothetical protein ACWD3Z_03360 [Streptomyces sp. NPDC002740]